MSLGPKARALLDAYRAQETLSVTHETELLRALQTHIDAASAGAEASPTPSAAGTSGGSAVSLAKLLALGAICVSAAALVWITVRPVRAPVSTRQLRLAPAVESAPQAPVSQPLAPVVESAQPTVPPVRRTRSADMPRPQIAPKHAVGAAARREGQEPKAMTRPTDAGATPGAQPGVEAELRALQQARSLLTHARPGEALRVLAELARTLPDGKLLDARALTRMEALCAAGQGARARAEAERFLALQPTSAFAGRVRAVCAE